MTCPGCGAPVAGSVTESCGSCGFPTGELRAAVGMMYFFTSAMFVSTLAYCALVVLVKLSSRGAAPSQTIMYVLVGLSVATSLVVLLWAAVPEKMAPAEARRRLIIQLALSESVAIYGLSAYFVSGKVQSFAMFLAGTLVLFVIVGLRVPRWGLAMRRHMYDRWEESRR